MISSSEKIDDTIDEVLFWIAIGLLLILAIYNRAELLELARDLLADIFK